MAKGTRGRRRISSRQCRPRPYPLPSTNNSKDVHSVNYSNIIDKKDWEDANCSVCMEYPHDAVLLLCSSHEKGCRPYMCGTSCRYSNCLDQYKKAYTKITSHEPRHGSLNFPAIDPLSGWTVEKWEVAELACPLCRGQVKGWTVVEPAREYLNTKKRSCMHDNCSFLGTYRELRKHVKAEHPYAKPREVDPLLEQKWRRLERDQERDDVISTIRSSMPGAVVYGDYVIEGSHYGFDSDEEEDDGFDGDAMERNEGLEVGIDRIENNFMNVFFLLQAFGSAGNMGSNRSTRRNDRALDGGGAPGVGRNPTIGGFDETDEDSDSSNNDDEDPSMAFVNRFQRQGRVVFGNSGRRRRRREAGGGGR